MKCTRRPLKTRKKSPKQKTKPPTRRLRKPKKTAPWIVPTTMVSVLLALIVFGTRQLQSGAPVPPPAPVAVTSPVDEGPLAEDFQHLQSQEIGERIAYWSERLASRPELRNDLSQFPDVPSIEDTAELIPVHFNCTTYVETVSALATSRSPRSFYSRLLSIRYKNSQARFSDRNHFPEADWIPNNTQAGNLRDITIDLAAQNGLSASKESKIIHRTSWLAAQLRQGTISRSPASLAEWTPPVEVSLPYIPLPTAARMLAKIPSGTIVNLVRKNVPRQPVLITHQGFIIQKNGKTYLRHSTPKGHLATVEFAQYLRVIGKRAKWPVIGLNLNQLLDPS